MFSRMNQSPVYPVSHFRQAQICFAMAKQVCAITTAIISIALMGVSTKSAYADDRFASSIFSTTGNFNNGLYRTPEALLGKPTTYVKDQFPGPGGTMNGTVAASMVFAAYNTDPSGGKLITTINTNEQITVKFDTPIVRDASHWFGQDFIVYGNSFFVGNGFVYGNTNMETYKIAGGGAFTEPTQVSVSPDGISWYTYISGPYGDDYFPTNPFSWDRTNHTWGAELDWTKPVNPALTGASFANLSVADAIDLYNGSAGGTPFSLAGTGFDSISYIRVTGIGNAGEIDGFSRVGFSSATVVPEGSTAALLGLTLPVVAMAYACSKYNRIGSVTMTCWKKA